MGNFQRQNSCGAKTAEQALSTLQVQVFEMLLRKVLFTKTKS